MFISETGPVRCHVSFKASQNSPNQKLAGVLPPPPLPGLYTEPTAGLLTLGQIFSPSIILKSPPMKICS